MQLHRLCVLTNASAPFYLAQIATLALGRLIAIWQTIRGHQRMEGPLQKAFLLWRSSIAICECIPYNSLPVDAQADVVSPSSQSLGVPMLESALKALSLVLPLRRLQATLIPSLDSFDNLIQAKDFRGIDELIWSVQLVEHATLLPLQLRFRQLSWDLHKIMCPYSSPWGLDSMLAHPLTLWFGTEAFPGNPTSLVEPSRSPSALFHGLGRDKAKPLAKLAISFGTLSDASPESELRFCYTWSILFHSIHHSPLRAGDDLYKRIFTDWDLFSFSQLVHRVQQISLRCIDKPRVQLPLVLDGFDDAHRHVAGLQRAFIACDPVARLAELREELEGLQALSKELEGIVVSSLRCHGHRQLRALVGYYIGENHCEKAVTMSLLPGHAINFAGIRAEYRQAESVLKLALDRGRKLYWQDFVGRAANDLLFFQRAIAELPDGHTKEQAKVRSALCDTLQEDVRHHDIETKISSGYQYKRGTQVIVTTHGSEARSALYEIGEDAAQELGEPYTAWTWAQMANEDMAMSCVERNAKSTSQGVPLLEIERNSVSGGADEEPKPIVQRHRERKLWVPPDKNRTVQEVKQRLRITLQAGQASSNSDMYSTDCALVTYSVHRRTQKIFLYLFSTKSEHCEMTAVTDSQVFDHLSQIRLITTDEGEPMLMASTLRLFDALVDPLARWTQPDVLLLLCPSGLLHCLPLHALEVEPGVPLITRNPVAYQPSFPIYERCLARALNVPALTSPSGSLAVTAVYETTGEEGVSSEERITWLLPANQKAIQETMRSVTDSLGGVSLWGESVTSDNFRLALESNATLFYVGHCGQEDEPAPGPGTAYLLLHDEGAISAYCHLVRSSFRKDMFTESDMQRLKLPSSLLLLAACGSSKIQVYQAEEPSSMMIAALAAGAAAVIGSMWTSGVAPTLRFVEELAKTLGVDASTPGVDLLDSAKAVRLAVVAVRSHFDHPAAWGPYALHGSPVVRNIFRRVKQEPIVAHE